MKAKIEVLKDRSVCQNIHAPKPSKNIKPLVLTGMGGLGKTTLATEYIHQYGSNYRNGCCWIETPKSQNKEERLGERVSQIVAYARLFQVYIDDSNPKFTKNHLNQAWNGLKDDINILFVIDDIQTAHELTQLVPKNKKNIRFLGTSRKSYLGSLISTLELNLPSIQDAVEQLKTLTAPEIVEAEIDSVMKILGTELMDRLPLAVNLLGGYVASQKTSFSSVLSRLKEIYDKWKPGKRTVIADPALNDLPEATNEHLGVAAIFNLTWERLESGPQKVAKVLGLFPNNFIDWHTVENAMEGGYPELQGSDFSKENLHVAECILNLNNLIMPIKGEKNYYICHTLIGDFLRSKITESDNTGWLNIVEKEIIKDTVKDIPELRIDSSYNDFIWYERRVKIIEKAYDNPGLIEDENLILYLFLSLSEYYKRLGVYEKAISVLEKFRRYAEKRFYVDHDFVMISMTHLAYIYASFNRYEEAEKLFIEVLEMRRLAFGCKDYTVVNILNDLGKLYRQKAQYLEAKKYHEEALAIQRKTEKSFSPALVTTLRYLSKVHANLGNYDQAKNLLFEALERVRVGYEYALNTFAQPSKDLAELYTHIESCDLAKAFSSKASAIEKNARILASSFKDHRLVGTIFNELALLYWDQKLYKEAEALFKEALAITRRVEGRENPNVSTILRNLGGLYEVQESYEEAETLYKEALESRKKFLGENHQFVANSLCDVSRLYEKQGRQDEANSLYERAEVIRTRFNSFDSKETT